MKNRVRAFTLVELLVVVSVILILSTLTVLNLSSTRARSRDEQRISSAQLIGSALDQYAMSNSRKYPTFLIGTGVVTDPSTSYYVEPINPVLAECKFCDGIKNYLNPTPEDSLNKVDLTNMKYVYNADGTKAAIIVDSMETNSTEAKKRLCNIDPANPNLPDPVKAYVGVPGWTLSPAGEGNLNACYYVSK